MPATTYLDVSREVSVTPDQTVSKALYKDESVKIVLFGFAPGQELSEHTASVPAILQILSGEATVTLGGETVVAKQDTLVHMPASLPHSIAAVTETRMLLFLLTGEKL